MGYRKSQKQRKRLRKLAVVSCLVTALGGVLVGVDVLVEASRPASRARRLAQKAQLSLQLGDTEGAAETLRESLALEPLSSERRVQLARVYALRGDAAQGEALLRDGLARQPADPKLEVALAQVLVSTWRPREARDLLAPRLDALRALAPLEGRSEGLRTAGVALAGSAAMDEALGLLEEAGRPDLATKEERAAALLVASRIYSSTWRLPEALQALEEADALAPGSAEITLALARVLEQNGQPVEAERRLRALSRSSDEARLLAARPLGELLVGRGRLAEARELADSLTGEASVSEAYLRAAIAAREGALPLAGEEYERLGALQAQSPVPYLMQARVALRRGDLAQARRAYEAALREAPGLPDAELALLALDQRARDVAAVEERAARLLGEPSTRASAVCALLVVALEEQAGVQSGLERLEQLRLRFPRDASIRSYTAIFEVLADQAPGPEDLERVASEPALAADLMLLARSQAGQTDAIEAIELFSELATKEPRFSTVRLVLGQLYARLGRYDLAVRHIDAALKERPTAAARLARARLALRAGDLARAAEELEAYRELDANDAVLTTLADVRSRQGELGAAIALLSEVSDRRPQDVRGHAKLARALARAGRDEEALARFELGRRVDRTVPAVHEGAALLLARGRIEAAHAAFEVAWTDTQDPRYAACLAVTRALKGELAGALPLIERYLREEPDATEGLLVKAVFLALAGRKADALQLQPTKALPAEVLAAAANLSPATGVHTNVRRELQAFALGVLGWREESRERLSRAVPGEEVDLLFLWWAVRRLGAQPDVGVRLSLLRQLYDHVSSSPYVGLDLAFLLQATGDSRGEVSVLEELRERFPDTGAVSLRLGQAYERAGRGDAALAQYARAAEAAGPAAGLALNNWAYLLGLQPKRRLEAIDLARRAVSRVPLEGELHDTLGWLLYQDGQVDLAVTRLSRAASLLPTRPTIRFHLGLAFRAQGAPRRARNNLSTAVLLGEFPERSEAQEVLAQLEAERGRGR